MEGMRVIKRQMVRIDEALCNGCGLCVVPCAEGAIEIADGKAKVLQEELCDGAGFCLSVCPTGALSIEVREAAPFDERTVEKRQEERGELYIVQSCFHCGHSEEQAVLIPCRKEGHSLWVCVRCLPHLIHG